jgi:hypothetical protein
MDESFCAICGSTLGSSTIGSSTPSALRRRQRIVAELGGKGRYYVNPGALEEGLLTPEEAHYGAYEHEVDEQPSGEPEHVQEWWLAADEDNSYHPYLVSQDSLAWLSESCCIGINPDLPGDSKCVTAQPPSLHL